MSTTKSDLQLPEILAILKACRQHDVAMFEFDQLKITFGRNQGALNQGHMIQDGSPAVSFEANQSEQRVEMYNQQLVQDMGHTQLMIDDPLGYEEAQASRDIERQRQRA